MSKQKAMDLITKFALAKNGKSILSQLDKYVKMQDKDNAIRFIINNSDCDQNTAIEVYSIMVGDIKPKLENTLSPAEIAHNRQEAQDLLNKPKCPTCNSTNLKKVSATSKVVNTAVFGLFGTKRFKQFHCNNCGYEW